MVTMSRQCKSMGSYIAVEVARMPSRRFYDGDWLDAGLGGLVLNTTKIPADVAAETVVRTVQAVEGTNAEAE